MKAAKHLFNYFLVLGLLFLDWAALHDILQGEPDTYGEYFVLAFSLIVFGLLIGLKMKNISGKVVKRS